MMKHLVLALGWVGWVGSLANPPNPIGKMVQDGVAVELAISETLQEGSDARFMLRLSDATTHTPLRNARPAAWLDAVGANPAPDNRVPGSRTPDSRTPDSRISNQAACQRKAASFIGSSLLRAPTLDLNAYYVLALNEDASISVIDPLSGFGGSKLLALISLPGVGQDWLLAPDQNLWVSIPEAGLLALVNTGNWQVQSSIAISGHPRQLALQAGAAQQVWVLTDTGAVVLSRQGQVLARIPSASAAHAIAFSDDGRTAFINHGAHQVSIIDAVALRKVRDVEISTIGKIGKIDTPGKPGKSEPTPLSIAWSAQAQLAYVANSGDGSIVALGADGTVAARIQALPGIGRMRFAPGGRFGFVLNPQQNRLDVIDSATNQIIHSAPVSDAPDQITFSDRMAYVRRRHSALVELFPLDEIGKSGGQPLASASFANGQKPYDQARSTSLADTMVATPNGNATLVANPAERSIHYYQEGMAAPLGSFRNYSREPRAVLVVDHSLQERSPGQYQANARLPRAGNYELVFFLDSPRVLHCFPVSIAADPAKPVAKSYAVSFARAANDPMPSLNSGQAHSLQFRISDMASGQTVSAIKDLQVLIFDASGIHQTRLVARELGTGIYVSEFTPAQPGHYSLHFQALSLGLRWNNAQGLTLTVQ